MSLERTNLFVLLNALKMLKSNPSYLLYKSIIQKDVENHIQLFVGKYSTANIYISCLQSDCLRLYQEIYQSGNKSLFNEVKYSIAQLPGPDESKKREIIEALTQLENSTDIDEVKEKLSLVRDLVGTAKDVWWVVKPWIELVWQGAESP